MSTCIDGLGNNKINILESLGLNECVLIRATYNEPTQFHEALSKHLSSQTITRFDNYKILYTAIIHHINDTLGDINTRDYINENFDELCKLLVLKSKEELKRESKVTKLCPFSGGSEGLGKSISINMH